MKRFTLVLLVIFIRVQSAHTRESNIAIPQVPLTMSKNWIAGQWNMTSIFSTKPLLGYNFGGVDIGDYAQSIGEMRIPYGTPDVLSWSVSEPIIYGDVSVVDNQCVGELPTYWSCNFTTKFEPKSPGLQSAQITFEQTVVYGGANPRTEKYSDTWLFYGTGTLRPLSYDICSEDNFIDQMNRVAGFQIPIVGTNLYLNYTNLFSRSYVPSSPTFQRPVHPNFMEDGMSVSIHHFYDRKTKRLFRGDGKVEKLGTGGGPDGALVLSSDGTEEYSFDENGIHLATFPAGMGTVKYSFGYDMLDTSKRLTSINILGHNVQLVRSANGALTKIIAPYGQETNIETGFFRNFISKVTTPGNRVYTLVKELGPNDYTELKFPSGRSRHFTYNSEGRVIRVYEKNISGVVDYDHFFEETRSGEVISRTALGRENIFSNKHGRDGAVNLSVITAAGSKLKLSEKPDKVTFDNGEIYAELARVPDERYSTAGHLRASQFKLKTEALGEKVVDFGLQLYPVIKLDRIFEGNTSSTSWNYSDRIATFTSAEGRTAKVTFDSRKRATAVQIGTDVPFKIEYDFYGAVQKIYRNVSMPQLRYVYNSQGYLYDMISNVGDYYRFGYDADGNLTSISNPGSVASFGYDPDGNLTSVTLPSGVSHGFDKSFGNGILTKYSPPSVSGLTVKDTVYLYNKDRQPTQVNKPDGNIISFQYNLASGLLRTITLPEGAIDFQYRDNSLSRISRVDTPWGVSNEVDFSGGWLKKETLLSSSGVHIASVEYSQGGANLLSNITVRDVTTGAATTSYTYDKDGLPTSIGPMVLNYGSGVKRLASTTLGGVTESWTYDTYGRVEGYTASYGSTVLYSYNLIRDENGKITNENEIIQGVASNYEYVHNLNWYLQGVKKNGSFIATFGYDANGNQTSRSFNGFTQSATYDTQDRISSHGLFTYTHTPNGEIKQESGGLGGAQYSYDSLGNLVAYTPGFGAAIGYSYDGFNRLVKRTSGGITQSQYLYRDGNRIVAELDSAGNMIKYFAYSPEKKTPEFMVSGGVTYKYISDIRGSPRLLVNTATGAVAQRIDYDISGRFTNNTAATFQPFAFGGGLMDLQASLVRFGDRFYNLNLGRFITRDLSLFNGRVRNLYSYGFNDPANFNPLEFESFNDRKAEGTFFGLSVPNIIKNTINSQFADTKGLHNFGGMLQFNNPLADAIAAEKWLQMTTLNSVITKSFNPGLGLSQRNYMDERVIQESNFTGGVCNVSGPSSLKRNLFKAGYDSELQITAPLPNQPTIWGRD